MKRPIPTMLTLIAAGLTPATVLAANIDLRETSAGIPLPWLLLGAFGVALVVTLLVRAFVGRRQDGA